MSNSNINRRQRRLNLLSDEELADLIEKDFQSNPHEFSQKERNSGRLSKAYMMSVSGKAVEPMRKWL